MHKNVLVQYCLKYIFWEVHYSYVVFKSEKCFHPCKVLSLFWNHRSQISKADGGGRG